MRCSLAAILVTALTIGGGGCASSRNGDVAGAQRALARELSARRQWPAAFQAANALCAAKPDDPEAYTLRGVTYREQRLSDEAEADFRQALALDEKYAAAHSALGLLMDGRSQHEEALAHHRRAVVLEPRNPAYLNNLGFALFASGRPSEAVEALRDAARWAPADRRIRNNLGFAYAATGDLVRAAEQFAAGGTPAEAKNNLGWAQERRGALAEALEAYIDAARADPAARVPRTNARRVARLLSRELPPEIAEREKEGRP